MPRNRSEKAEPFTITIPEGARQFQVEPEGPQTYTLATPRYGVSVTEIDGMIHLSINRHDGTNGYVMLNGRLYTTDIVPF